MTEEKKRNIWFVLTIITSSVYLLWRIFFTIPWNGGVIQAAAGIILILAETVTTLGMAELMVSRMKNKGCEIPLPDIPAGQFPEIDVLIATHNEPEELLYKTVNACTFLEYPDRSKVHVYVCDDGNRTEIKEMAEHLGAGYLGLATAIGSSISFLAMLSHFFTKKNTLRLVKPEGLVRKLRKITATGFSTFFIDVAMGILTILFNRQIMVYLGTNALSVYGVIVNISTFVQCCAYSVRRTLRLW